MQLSAIQNQFKYCFLVLIVIVSFNKATAQTINYETEFGSDYQRAVRFLEKNTWITDTLSKYNVPAQFAVSVIFPELIRYSALRDQIEIGGLKILYASFGPDYADFSIGNFQMKPSFAEFLIEDLKGSSLSGLFSNILTDTKDEAGRKLLVRNLESLQKQVLFLAAFYRICEQKFKQRKWRSEEEKLLFYATAYNCGYRQTADYISKKIYQKHFVTSIFGEGQKYAYADIALYFFKKQNYLAKSSN